jgi:preprotein translocase subunit SecB
MADEDEQNDGDGIEGGADQLQPALNVLAQYIKDLSFESPNAPGILQKPASNPRLDVSVNVQAGGDGKEVFEVALHVDAHAKSDEGIVYNVELVYAGMFRLKDIARERLQAVLFIDCPALLFPFARRLIADLTRDGGFPPLMLDPIDFAMLYRRNLADAQQEAAQAPKN